MASSRRPLSVVDSFVAHWPEEIEKYEKLAKWVEAICASKLEMDNIRHTIKSRPKAQRNLKDSIKRRQQRRGVPYQDSDEIKHDMVDLAGVRIALTFPNDAGKVREIVQRAFDPYLNPWDIAGPELESSIINRNGLKRRRKNDDEWPLGLKSLHLRCKLKESDRKFAEYKGLGVEIQVGTGLMYAWEDVYHDIVYKPYFGKITPEEERFIEILNGLVHTGELALKQLSESLTLRLELDSMPFKHLEHLRAWLYKTLLLRGDGASGSQFYNTGLLYELLLIFNLDMPAKLWPVLVSCREVITRSKNALRILFSGDTIWWNFHPLKLRTVQQQIMLLAVMHMNARYIAQRCRRINVSSQIPATTCNEDRHDVKKAFDLDPSEMIFSAELFNSWKAILKCSIRRPHSSYYIWIYKLAFELACRGMMHGNPTTLPRSCGTLATLFNTLDFGCKNITRSMNLECQETGWYRFDWDLVWQLDSVNTIFDYDSLLKDGTVSMMFRILEIPFPVNILMKPYITRFRGFREPYSHDGYASSTIESCYFNVIGSDFGN
ncbi:hypothetical protein F5Y11DRAFT_344016 [Daldinia sp. FL1419]|nr:hypothetical protein F5Y11DRAFT_344016 [Daldinia sp. FL1419]